MNQQVWYGRYDNILYLTMTLMKLLIIELETTLDYMRVGMRHQCGGRELQQLSEQVCCTQSKRHSQINKYQAREMIGSARRGSVVTC